MAGCSYVVSTRTEMSKDNKVKVTENYCGLVPAEGSDFCPRHGFLREVAAEAKRDKELQKQQKQRDGSAGMPQTREQLLRRGYEYHGCRNCVGCDKLIEWWKTPKGNMAPFDPMPELSSHCTSHFATCVRRDAFRRAG